ncbi:hypothetical protein [Marinobacterium stanieri]|uniref:Uncharacterized protein n=1 Tax=Marinobacterium stanieri TaxID=49186 RepID=A0A1N6QC40_9GAMM|nr:hypothetical protein [Marinobacterium stanieri]SIQ14161.1 hypothetical protein SAMN05421647_102410 [Marinobacterium stanieri]
MSVVDQNVVHGIDVVALVKKLRAIPTRHDRKQTFMWETSRMSPISRSEVEKAMRAQWKESVNAD